MLRISHLRSVAPTELLKLADCSRTRPAAIDPERTLRNAKTRHSSGRKPARIWPIGKAGDVSPVCTLTADVVRASAFSTAFDFGSLTRLHLTGANPREIRYLRSSVSLGTRTSNPFTVDRVMLG